ncbi:hypothetical protein A2833_03395 [Candidatus Azambacteria bacterium RIFCSPHIGHO2_01_FULL_44_55]|uniref:CusB-like beta-barrel domain-containing protein n=1 Tax=Candidatus Azambacteria bacterium RIFCSPLOWO2_02_FULL_44_14 TaxID=1797306 RepID=A0A1F5CCE5_9BACT|nr:MAG: hypothetical protein A3A18_00760 [Candidatus Azambacteria bacterium RIFCSPLOWO2_01_FULL_44_84]OGD32871.1 MAG: hypothetical protein A3C78_00905 [Candidatus Azambacteria bacterium RIFCSPHIGHO2_02_FULL_45_18]OGD39771.1 MAG: hypothetical protein A2833_03395 [Candidatus Azambacteria bacterium RIFCSPHIGHO2_01_FULL_44_55]OGD40514.1 MAG: hypothetical protein A3I30_00935 [Candidatus Azambacteria bacterium RIFCSPLOWO2_02_FULL_44_14]OGD52252.1 MAG: hypothetical protein A2608_02765 [Candidatus Azam
MKKKSYAILLFALLILIISYFISGLAFADFKPYKLLGSILMRYTGLFDPKNNTKNDSQLKKVQVERGNIEKTVNIDDGKVASEKKFELEFPFNGIVEKIFISEGQLVKSDDPLIQLETIDFELEIRRLKALSAQSTAKLAKLTYGATREELEISKTKVTNAETTVLDAKNVLIKVLEDNYISSDNAIRHYADQSFTNPQGISPETIFSLADSQLKTDLRVQRIDIETLLKNWQKSINDLSSENPADLNTDQLLTRIQEAKKNLLIITQFLDTLILALNNAINDSTTPQATTNSLKLATATSRANVNSTKINLEKSIKDFNNAESAHKLAQKELNFVEAGTRDEDIKAVRAEIDGINNQISTYKEKIRKSTIYSPADGLIVSKIELEKGELFKVGHTAISLEMSNYKIEAKIPQDEISGIRAGIRVTIRFEAIENREFNGEIASIDTQELTENDDVFFKANIYLDNPEVDLRPGMTADVNILAILKEAVLKIPKKTIIYESGRNVVTILEAEEKKNIQIETGVSDDNYTEVISGLDEGDVVIESPDNF